MQGRPESQSAGLNQPASRIQRIEGPLHQRTTNSTPADDMRAFPVTSRSGSSDTTCFQPRAPEEAQTDHVTPETKN